MAEYTLTVKFRTDKDFSDYDAVTGLSEGHYPKAKLVRVVPDLSLRHNIQETIRPILSFELANPMLDRTYDLVWEEEVRQHGIQVLSYELQEDSQTISKKEKT